MPQVVNGDLKNFKDTLDSLVAPAEKVTSVLVASNAAMQQLLKTVSDFAKVQGSFPQAMNAVAGHTTPIGVGSVANESAINSFQSSVDQFKSMYLNDRVVSLTRPAPPMAFEATAQSARKMLLMEMGRSGLGTHPPELIEKEHSAEKQLNSAAILRAARDRIDPTSSPESNLKNLSSVMNIKQFAGLVSALKTTDLSREVDPQAKMLGEMSHEIRSREDLIPNIAKDIRRRERVEDRIDSPSPKPTKEIQKIKSFGLFQSAEEMRESSRLMATGKIQEHQGYDYFKSKEVQFAAQGVNIQQLESALTRATRSGNEELVQLSRMGLEVSKKFKDSIEKQADATKEAFSAYKKLEDITAPGSKASPQVVSAVEKEYELKNLASQIATKETQALHAETEKIANAVEKMGGGEGGGGGFGGLIKTMSTFLTGVASAVGGGYMAYKTVEVAARQEVLGKERMAYDYQLSTGGLEARRTMEAFDITKPENFLKYRGDVLFPGHFKYLGASGSQTAEAVASREVLDRMGLSKAIYEKAGGQLAVGVAGGALQMAGAAASVATPGVAAIAGISGANQMLSSFQSYYQEMASNDYSQFQGGVSGTLGGKAAWGPNEAKYRAKLNAESKFNEYQYLVQQERDELQRREVEEHPVERTALEQAQRQVGIRQRGVLLVGKYAWTGPEANKAIYPDTTGGYGDLIYAPGSGRNIKKQQGTIEEIRDAYKVSEARSAVEEATRSDIRAKDQLIASNKTYPVGTVSAWDLANTKAGTEKSTTEAEKAARNLVSAKTRMIDVGFESDAESLRSVGGNMQKLAEKRAEFTKAQAKAPDIRTSWASSLGLTIPEAQANADMISNVLGYGRRADLDSGGITESFTKLSRSGLGDFQQLLGNVASLNQATGGQNNIEQLKSVLGAAVASGFDKSRVAQQFVNSSIGLADALKLSRADLAAGQLSEAIKWSSATGKGDEKAMQMAAQGIKEYSSFATQTGGVIGAYRTYSLLAAGATPGEMNMLGDVSPVEAAEMQETTKGWSGKTNLEQMKGVKNRKLQLIIQSSYDMNLNRFLSEDKIKGMDPVKARSAYYEMTRRNLDTGHITPESEQQFVNPEFIQAIGGEKELQKFNYINTGAVTERVNRLVGSIRGAGTAFLSGAYQSETGRSLESETEVMRVATEGLKAKGLGKEKTESLKMMQSAGFAHLVAAGQNESLPIGAAIASGADYLVQHHIDAVTVRRLSDEAINKTNNQYIDAGQQKLSAAINEITARGAGKVSWNQFTELMDKGLVPAIEIGATSKNGGTGIQLTRELLKKMGETPSEQYGESGKTYAQLEALAKQDVAKMDNIEMAKQMEWQMGQDSQKVHITNAWEIGQAVAGSMQNHSSAPPIKTVTLPSRNQLKQP